MSATPDPIKGHIILVAHITAAPGKGDEVQALVSKLRDSAVSDAEPGVLVYRVSRYNDEFVHFEEYESAKALETHQTLQPFLNLVQAGKDGIVARVELGHYAEI